MQILYRKSTGEIMATLDGKTEAPLLPRDNEDVITTLVEHGGGVRHLRVDLETKKLVPKSAILFHIEKHEVRAGEPIALTFSFEGEQFGEKFPLRVKNDQIIHVPYAANTIEIAFDLPGEYTLSIPDLRIYSIPKKVIVKEDTHEV